MDTLREVLTSGLTGSPRPLYPGAVAMVVRDGTSEPLVVVGDALRYEDADGAELPLGSRVAMREETIFDVASITKLFTATVLMTLVEEGRLALDAPIAQHLPTFRGRGRRAVTLRHLLSHTSGLPDLLRLWTDWPSPAARRRAVLQAPLKAPSGTQFEYSCIGYMVAGFLAERVSHRTLPELVQERICEPLRLADTGYRPTADRLARIAATEFQPTEGRGMVRGSVHDQNAWSLGGTVGNAGIFSTAADLARFGETLRRGGEMDGVRILQDASVAEMLSDQLPERIDPGFRHGLGVRIGDPKFMSVLAASGAVGHTGFTGTSLVIDVARSLVVVLLTNRVHPSRNWSDIAAVRCRVAELAAAGAPAQERPA